MYSMSVSALVRAPRAAVYRALLDPAAVARWRAPDGMTAEVHDFDPREGEARHDGIPDQVPAADNETGTRMSLANLAAHVEKERT